MVLFVVLIFLLNQENIFLCVHSHPFISMVTVVGRGRSTLYFLVVNPIYP